MRMIRFDRKSILMIVALVFAMAIIACPKNQSTIQTSYDAASVSFIAYDTAMQTMGDLYKQGYVSEEQKEKAIALGRIYKDTHNAMVEALATYQENGGDANKNAYLIAAARAGAELSNVLSYVNQFITKKGG